MISEGCSIQLPRTATLSDMSRQRFARSSSTSREVSPLIHYTLRGLQNCWMPDLGRWSHIYHLDGRDQPNQSVPESDVFYTLNVLLGFSRNGQGASSDGLDLREIFRTNVALVPKLNSPKYAYGMALWAAAELGFDIPADTRTAIAAVVEHRKQWKTF